MPRRARSGRTRGGSIGGGAKRITDTVVVVARPSSRRTAITLPVLLLAVSFALILLVPPSSASDAPPPLQPKLIGGKETPPGRYPYLVSVTTRTQETLNHHTCGAMLIAPDVVLTAAHCPDPLDGVEIGRHIIASDDDDDDDDDENEDENWGKGQGYERFVIESVLRHPQYDVEYKRDYDYMLLKIHGLSTHQPVKLNRDSTVPAAAGAPLTIVGWGMTDYDVYELSPILREVEVNYVPNEVCSQVTGEFEGKDVTYGDRISDRMMCAADVDHKDDSCMGDSGGPLVQKGLDGRPETDVLVGIVSYGFGCAEKDFPGIYSRISSAVDDWLVPELCSLSAYPPNRYECSKGDDFLESSTLERGGRKVKVNVRIEMKLDGEPYQTGWLLKDAESGEIYASAPIGTYGTDDYQDEEIVTDAVVDVDKFGSRFTFVVMDWERGGLKAGDDGWYRVYVYDELVIDEEGRFEGSSITHDFFIDAPPTEEPTEAPTPSPTANPTDSPTDSPTTVPPTSVPPTAVPTSPEEEGVMIWSVPPAHGSVSSQSDSSSATSTNRGHCVLLLPLLVASGLSMIAWQ